MKVIVAIPFEYDGKKYSPDEPADLPDDVAKTRVHDGWARLPKVDADEQAGEGANIAPEPVAAHAAEQVQADPPPPKSGTGSGVNAWVDYAAAHGVAVPQDAKREDIIAALEQAGVPTEPAQSTTDSPTAGATGQE